MLEKLAYPRSQTFPRLLVAGLWVLYFVVFELFHHQIGPDIGALAIFPIIAAGWYLGFRASLLVAVLMIFANFTQLLVENHVTFLSIIGFWDWIDNLIMLFVGVIVGKLGMVLREHRTVMVQLQGLENERENHAHFISTLNDVTWTALEAKDLESVLNRLAKQIAELFDAEDCFFALWDEVNQSPVPTVAYGPASDIYPSIRLDPGEPSIAAWILESGRPLVISDLENSSYRKMVSPKMIGVFNTKAVLGLPLATRDHKLGVMYLGYHQVHHFSEQDIKQGQLAARQIALALSRVQSFEEAERRVKELAVLHEIALAPTQVEGVDSLLDLATEIIGRNLFPDNFGILLLDEKSGLLRFHPSYRVYPLADYNTRELTVPLEQGVTGQVARDGISQRLGDVRQIENYLNVDPRTRSELCVPLKSRERILGVINAESMELNAFTASDEKLMTTLAGQLATALEYLHSLEAERHWMDRLAHSNELISALSRLTAEIEKALNPSEVIKTLKEEFQKLGLTSLLALYLPESDQMLIQYSSLLSKEHERAGKDVFGYKLRADKMETLFGIENVLMPMVLPAPLAAMEIILGALPKTIVEKTLSAIGVTAGTEIIHLPLLLEDRLLGALWLWGNDLTRADLPVMSIFARQVAITLENARLFEEAQNLALTDPLSGLHNRRGLFEIGKIEFARARRANRPFSAIMVDIDHFKRINDTYGHFTGDRVLQNFAHICKNSIRDVDLIGRYGGEEIVILLPETDLAAGVEVAERVRKAVSDVSIKITDELEIKVTASLGVAQQVENAPNLETLIARADQAMYTAKNKGRNQVAISS